MESPGQLYDETSTIFSPVGRLYQVEYAREAVKKGSTTMGFKSKDGVILLAHKPEASRLVNVQSLEKIYQIDDHIACAATGLVADGRHLVEIAREEAQWNKALYGEPISVKHLVNIISEYEHLYTQFEGVRPFGVVLLIGGIDRAGHHLYSTDPSGAYFGYKAVCEGRKSNDAMSQLNKGYSSELSLPQALDLGLQTLQKITRKRLNVDMIDVAVIDEKEGYKKLSSESLQFAAEKQFSSKKE